MCFEKFMNKVG